MEQAKDRQSDMPSDLCRKRHNASRIIDDPSLRCELTEIDQTTGTEDGSQHGPLERLQDTIETDVEARGF